MVYTKTTLGNIIEVTDIINGLLHHQGWCHVNNFHAVSQGQFGFKLVITHICCIYIETTHGCHE